MAGYKKRQILRNIVWIFTYYLDYHAFLTSFNTKFPYNDKFLERINRANRGISAHIHHATTHLSPHKCTKVCISTRAHAWVNSKQDMRNIPLLQIGRRKM